MTTTDKTDAEQHRDLIATIRAMHDQEIAMLEKIQKMLKTLEEDDD